MKLYILEIGDYSDRYVVGIFSTRENAEKVGECYPNETKTISDYDLDIHFGQPPGMIFFSFRIRVSDGYMLDLEVIHPRFDGPCIANCGEYIFGRVWARDHEHATKIASEKRQHALREQLNQSTPN